MRAHSSGGSMAGHSNINTVSMYREGPQSGAAVIAEGGMEPQSLAVHLPFKGVVHGHCVVILLTHNDEQTNPQTTTTTTNEDPKTNKQTKPPKQTNQKPKQTKQTNRKTNPSLPV